MNYKITAFDPLTGRITIKPEGLNLLEIDLPIDENNKVYEGELLHKFILGFLPLQQIQREEKLAHGIVNAEAIHSLVEFHEEPVIPEFKTQPVGDILRMQILSVLFEEGVIK